MRTVPVSLTVGAEDRFAPAESSGKRTPFRAADVSTCDCAFQDFVAKVNSSGELSASAVRKDVVSKSTVPFTYR
jgi:hypothetical protein